MLHSYLPPVLASGERRIQARCGNIVKMIAMSIGKEYTSID
jgi:hypothetical protein